MTECRDGSAAKAATLGDHRMRRKRDRLSTLALYKRDPKKGLL